MSMSLDDALATLDQVITATEVGYPELSQVTQGARATAVRIVATYNRTGDINRADIDLANLLADVLESTQRAAGVRGNFTPEYLGGPPSPATMGRIRAQNRAAYGIADGPVPVSSNGNGAPPFQSVTIRANGHPIINWLLRTFGGPILDLNQPSGTVSVDPWDGGNPTTAIAFLASLAVAFFVAVSYCAQGRRRVA